MDQMQNPQTQLAPEQVKIMQLMVRQAMEVILGDEAAEGIVATAKAGDPVKVATDLVAPLLQKITEAADMAGVKIEMITAMVAGVQVIAMVAKMLEAGGVLTEQDIPQFVATVSKASIEKHNASVGAAGGGQPPGGAAQPGAGGMPPQGAMQ